MNFPSAESNDIDKLLNSRIILSYYLVNINQKIKAISPRKESPNNLKHGNDWLRLRPWFSLYVTYALRSWMEIDSNSTPPLSLDIFFNLFIFLFFVLQCLFCKSPVHILFHNVLEQHKKPPFFGLVPNRKSGFGIVWWKIKQK